MMKYSLLALLLFLSSRPSFAQPEMLKGTWITAEQDLIEILEVGRTSSNYMSNKLLNENHFHLFVFGDTLSFQHIYTNSLTQFKVEYIDRYDLKIVSCSDSILIIRPVSKFSKTFFQNRPVLKLKKKQYLVDKTIVFEKLVYHASRAWNGPTVAMQVDSNKNLYMRYTNNTGGLDRGLASGNYKAVLDDDTYKELIKQLQNCNLRTLRFGDIKGHDSPDITLIMYFNGKRKYLKSMFPPRISEELLTFIILRLQGYGKLILTEENRDLEWRP
jgi:hypothetical protein